ncbi:RAMP superfamily CRISPR-associated protein [Streptosporangium sp. NPDC049078]|uniref:RAMP superfamily CRISPR-associated protein n=1 Tax=Streptosporangium sp. NPDC049078 TaxID=3155767 RepID=UPI003419D228
MRDGDVRETREIGEFDISLFMISDWRVGTGTGIQGYTDRLIQRDADRVVRRDTGSVRRGGKDADKDARALAAPIVPAKTLIGVWRDSCELAAHALDSGPAGVWHDWLGFLFGGQYATATGALRPAALVVEGPLRFPERLAELLREKPLVSRATTFRKPGVAIDARTGTARADMLRFEEMARAGVTLRGRGRIEGFAELSQAQREIAVALLDAGARLLESVGGKRRRGAGRCRMTVEGEGFAPGWTMPDELEAPPSVSPYAVADRPVPADRTARSGWERAELVITVREAVLVAATVMGNVVQGATHIPGWCLMPEVTRRLGGAAHALVRTGDLLVTAATPESGEGGRTLPVPRVLVHEKGGTAIVGNRMAEAEASGKPYRDGYVAVEGERFPEAVNPALTVRMHNSVDDRVQRPIREIGGVYVYRALAAGTVLRAEVRVRTGMLEEGWERRLDGRWRVGRSSKDDYGQVEVKARPAADRRRPGAEGDLLRVWLLSDLLVRDVRLRPSTEVVDVGRALERALVAAGAAGVRLVPVTEPRDGRVSVALGVHRTESWHRGWGLPRSTLYGLAAGSCLTFTVTGGPIDPEALAEVRAAGVGERRAEGFGQVEFDHDLLLRPVAASDSADTGSGAAAGQEFGADADGVIGTGSPDASSVPHVAAGTSQPIAPNEEGYENARIFERAAWRTEIHRACERIRGNRGTRRRIIPDRVSNTQLNALREIVADLPSGRAGRRLERLAGNRAGRPAWPDEAVERLRALLVDADPIWTLLGLPEEELTVTADGVTTLRAELRDEAVRVLVTACLAAHSRDKAAGAGARTGQNGHEIGGDVGLVPVSGEAGRGREGASTVRSTR